MPCCQNEKRMHSTGEKREERKKEKKRREEGPVWRQRWGEPLLRMCAGRASETAEDGRRWTDGSRELAMPRICRVAGRKEQLSLAWRGGKGWTENERTRAGGQRFSMRKVLCEERIFSNFL